MTTAYLLLGNDLSLETQAGLPIGKMFAYKEMEKPWQKRLKSSLAMKLNFKKYI